MKSPNSLLVNLAIKELANRDPANQKAKAIHKILGNSVWMTFEKITWFWINNR
jgi:hypothetical protein